MSFYGLKPQLLLSCGLGVSPSVRALQAYLGFTVQWLQKCWEQKALSVLQPGSAL